MTKFRRIHLENWRQFGSVDIDLSAQTTILTGSNGCGKTSVLNILSKHFGWNLLFVSTPYISKRSRRRIYSDWRQSTWDEEQTPEAPCVGFIDYEDGARCTLRAPEKSGQNAQYHLVYDNQRSVVGLHIPSHRPPISYQPISQIPTNPKNNQQLYREFQSVLFQSISAQKSQNPGLILKQSLVSLAVFGYGSEAVSANDEYREIFDSFQEVLRILLPAELGFRRIEIRMPDVVLVTDSGDFSLDAMSGGVSSVLGLAWQIHIFGSTATDCTVLIDEPENHLHPRMQRTLLPNLARAFPGHRFVVATHSPFIVSSNEFASVYGLKYSDDRRVHSVRLDSSELSSSPEQVLREILDVPSVMPVWVEDRIRGVMKRHANGTSEDAKAIYEEIRALGLSDVLSDLPERMG